MSQSIFNIYFIASAIWLTINFFLGITDDERKFVDNDLFMINLFASLINLVYAVYHGTKTPNNK